MKTESCKLNVEHVWTNYVDLIPSEPEEAVLVANNSHVDFTPLDKPPQDIDPDISNELAKNSINSQNLIPKNYLIIKDKNDLQRPLNNKNQEEGNTNFDDLLYFVCNLCPFLCTENSVISEHLENAHKNNKQSRKLQQLKCPACANVFYHKISLKSHLIHDHGVTNFDLSKIIQAVVYYATTKSKSNQSKSKQKQQLSNCKKEIEVKCLEETKCDNRLGIIHDLCDSEIILESEEQTKPNTVGFSQFNPIKVDYIIDKTPKQNAVSKLIDQKKLQKCVHPSCKVKLQDEEKMTYHVNSHVDSSFKCLECDEFFSCWKILTGHLWRVHRIDMELYSCNKCDYKTYSLGKLNNVHKLIHSDIRAYVCNVCQKGFKNNKQLNNHKNIHKEKSEKYSHICEACSRSFSSKRQLKLHMNVVHNKIKPFLCNYCGYKGSSKSSLKMHVRQHTGEKPFSCQSCSYTTSDHNSLRRHKLRHSGQKPYQCAYCPYACIQSSTYKVHLKTKHPGQETNLMFTCHQCQFRSVNKNIFISHMTSVHDQNPQLQSL